MKPTSDKHLPQSTHKPSSSKVVTAAVHLLLGWFVKIENEKTRENHNPQSKEESKG